MDSTRKKIKAFLRGGLVPVFVVTFAGQAAAQTWIQLFPGGTLPTPRYSAGQAYDAANDRLILFSGEDDVTPAPPRLQDVWVLMNATGLGGAPSWVQLLPTGGPPLGRYGGTVLYDPTSNRIIVHGGCSANCGFAMQDTWVLTNANGSGGTPNWQQLASAPVGRAEHSAAYDPANNRMIVFGGHTAFFGTDRNDVWVLSDANGVGSPVWTQLFPTGSPPSGRRGASVTYDQASNRLTVFGGGQFPNSFTGIEFNDVWVLTNANGLGGTPQWIQLFPTGGPPSVRAGHILEYDPSTNRAILFGGACSTFPGTPCSPTIWLNDVWVLTNANGLGGTPQWIQLSPSGSLPAARIWASSGYSTTSNRLVVALGRNDIVAPFLFNDHWVLMNATGIIDVAIDIKPGSFPNSINPKSKGKIPVAILTTGSFDATTVDPTTVLFGPTGTEAAPVHSALEDVDGDGDTDLILHFNTQATGIQCGDTSASLTGETFGGDVIQGSDSVRTVGCP